MARSFRLASSPIESQSRSRQQETSLEWPCSSGLCRVPHGIELDQSRAWARHALARRRIPAAGFWTMLQGAVHEAHMLGTVAAASPCERHDRRRSPWWPDVLGRQVAPPGMALIGRVSKRCVQRHYRATGRPAACHSGKPSSSRRASKPLALSMATASNDRTQ